MSDEAFKTAAWELAKAARELLEAQPIPTPSMLKFAEQYNRIVAAMLATHPR